MLYGAKIMVDKYKELKTDFTEKSPINISKVEPGLHNKINSYVNLMNENKTTDDNNKYKVRDYILELVENDLKGLVLHNRFIELENPIYFNLTELNENRVVTSTKNIYDIDLNEAIVVEKIPNNFDTFNASERTYCQGDDTSKHAGIYILPNLDGGEDHVLIFNYDSDTQTSTIRLGDNIENYFDKTNKDEMKLKDDLLSIVNDIKTDYSNGELVFTSDYKEYCIMYSYLNHKQLREFIELKIAISSQYKEEFTLNGLLFKGFNKE